MLFPWCLDLSLVFDTYVSHLLGYIDHMHQFLLRERSGFDSAGSEPQASNVWCGVMCLLFLLLVPHEFGPTGHVPFLSSMMVVHPVAQGMREGAIVVSTSSIARFHAFHALGSCWTDNAHLICLDYCLCPFLNHASTCVPGRSAIPDRKKTRRYRPLA
jgi:hypothetical protein